MEWTTTERATLGNMWLAGTPRPEIARTLGATVSAVMTKAGRLGLPDAWEMRKGRTSGSMRPCMCCDGPFYSAGKFNRLCLPCKNDASLN